MNIKDLDRIAIIGTGLLGGSIGLALQATGFAGTRIGIGRRLSTLQKAIEYETVDEITTEPADGVRQADLVILCTPIGTFESMLQRIAPALKPGCYVTDVASTKTEVVRLARKLVPKHVRFVGSHPMAGSENAGVEFARADLFENALCLVTPTKATPPGVVRDMRRFWEALGGRTTTLDPRKHDRLLARVSHLPHAVASALVRLSEHQDAIELAGPGFGDTTRIASGEPAMWTDIFRTNAASMTAAIDALIKELSQLRDRLARDDARAIEKWLTRNKDTRDRWVAQRYQGRKRQA